MGREQNRERKGTGVERNCSSLNGTRRNGTGRDARDGPECVRMERDETEMEHKGAERSGVEQVITGRNGYEAGRKNGTRTG